MPIFNPILVRAGGGAAAPVSPKEVNFYDYEGTLLHAYTVAQAQALAALPDGPAHEGLVFQGWNWSLADVKALDRPMNVGAMYITDDGKTRLYIRIAALGRMDVPLYFSQTAANGVTIDWGDGSPAETLAGTGYVNTVHTYADVGDYTISLNPAAGCELGLGAGSDPSYCVMGSTKDNELVYCNMLQRAEIGRNVSRIGNYVFYYCYSLASITIPDSVTSIGGIVFSYCYSLASITIPGRVTKIENSVFKNCYSLASIAIPGRMTSIWSSVFQNCYSLASITIPGRVTSIGIYVFQNCYSLASITIPGRVTSIGDYVFYYCYSLASITIPDSVTSIGDYAFRYCYGMAEYHLKPTTPPTLNIINAFGNIPSDCIIYVPKGCLAAYQTATNWATYADYMREEP